MLDMGYVYEEINVKHFVPPSYDLSISGQIRELYGDDTVDFYQLI